MDFNDIIPRLMADGRLSHLKKMAFLALVVAGGASEHVQHMTLREIGEHVDPPVSQATMSPAIKVLRETGWIEASKPSEKESFEFRITGPVVRKGKVEVFEHRVKGAKVTVTIESVEEN